MSVLHSIGSLRVASLLCEKNAGREERGGAGENLSWGELQRRGLFRMAFRINHSGATAHSRAGSFSFAFQNNFLRSLEAKPCHRSEDCREREERTIAVRRAQNGSEAMSISHPFIVCCGEECACLLWEGAICAALEQWQELTHCEYFEKESLALQG